MLTWTSEPPKKDGWYWLKKSNYSQCVYVDVFRTGPVISVCGSEADFFLHDFSNAKWAGPIPEPMEELDGNMV